MARWVLLAVIALELGGCAATTAVVEAATTVVGAGAKVAGNAVSATVVVVGAGVSGAVKLATGDPAARALAIAVTVPAGAVLRFP